MDEQSALDPRTEARQRLLAWLTLAFRDPQEVPVEDLARADLSAWAADAGIPLGELPAVPVEAAEDLGQRLAPEYVRLFVNAVGHDLAHLEGVAYLIEEGPLAQSEWMAELGAHLQHAGYTPEEGSSRSADHLSLLLEYLYREESLVAPGESPFARRFLLPWLGTMLGRLAAAEPHPFYERAGRTLAACFGLPFPPDRGDS